MGLIGGLALFLFGMDQMAAALKLIAGDGLRKILSKLTTNRFTGAIAGAVITSIIQSSSVTTVLVVGFISAGLMNLSQSIGIIMGANIGTTMTAQIIAFKVTQYALLLIGTGFSLSFFLKNEHIRHYGKMIMGLGLVFYGMQLMSDGTKPLQSYAPFIEFMRNMNSPLLGIAFGALFTALVQSSSATTGIVIVLASQGFLPLPAGIALIFGANIGTCFTAWLASLGKSLEAKRAVTVHVLFNMAGVILWFFFIPQLAEWVKIISPQAAGLDGAQRLASETPRQIANAHTVFNVTNTLIFIWLVGPIGKWVVKLIPDRPFTEAEKSRPKYLDSVLLSTPALALNATRLELNRMGKAVIQITDGALETVIDGNTEDLRQLWKMDSHIDEIHTAILRYLGALSRENLDEKQSDLMHRYLAVANYLENIADMVETNLVESGRGRLNASLVISESTRKVLSHFHQEVSRQVAQAVDALVANDHGAADEVITAKPRISELASAAEKHLSQRLVADEPQRMIAFHLESELIEYLKRMYYFAKRIAKIVKENPSPQEMRVPTSDDPLETA
ncbi:MAG: Na/Pi cotransporter family protein [Verrucomicrobiae bacterium]|nr:Na/Pi cotransporter family protein [Verrucomicrobiae bacterium]NNJ44157.1 Na/Pi cotransporter family protein [Akkermansiaceae bacterium]